MGKWSDFGSSMDIFYFMFNHKNLYNQIVQILFFWYCIEFTSFVFLETSSSNIIWPQYARTGWEDLPEIMKRMCWARVRAGDQVPYSVTNTNISLWEWNGVQHAKNVNTTATKKVNNPILEELKTLDIC